VAHFLFGDYILTGRVSGGLRMERFVDFAAEFLNGECFLDKVKVRLQDPMMGKRVLGVPGHVSNLQVWADFLQLSSKVVAVLWRPDDVRYE